MPTSAIRLVFASVLGLLTIGRVVPCAVAGIQEGLAAYATGDYAGALREFRPLAEGGDEMAQSLLAEMYARGQGVPRDYAEAAKWWRLAAEQGRATAQVNLGQLYDVGLGVPRDHAEAVKWYRRAAEQGLHEAQVNLGALYAEGRGTPQDYVRAHMWFSLAAAHQQPGEKRDRAVRNRDRLAQKMTSEQIAEAQRLAREWKPRRETPPQ